MNDIPEDVMKAALAVAYPINDKTALHGIIVNGAVLSIMAERERCEAALSTDADPATDLQSVDARDFNTAIQLLPHVMRPSLRDAILSTIEEQRHIIAYFKRTSHARHLAFEAALTAQVQDVAGWQDISTAPKDGTEVIGCFSDDYGHQEKPTVYGPWTMRFSEKEWVSSWDKEGVVKYEDWSGTDYKDLDLQPTHWMPMPKPPVSS